MSFRSLVLVLLSAVAWGQTFDGPAELPRITIASDLSNTPSPNSPKTISASDNLQTALNGAVCGDNFLVDPSLIYTTSTNFHLPTLACDSVRWITVQVSGLTVIDENTRIHPGIPMPKIILSPGTRVVGGAFVRLIGIEITRLEGSAYTGAFVAPGVGAHDLVIDRSYIHGTSDTESVRGIDLSSVPNVAVINSWISDFHCAGSCGDSQAIAGGFGVSLDGNYLIQNNYLEASGENILFGGSSATTVPTDITIRYNDFNKPDSWNPRDPSYGGHPWSVKNLLEFKTGIRVLVEGNRMTGAWGGFSQGGFGILLTPKNQGGQCSVCSVADVTVRNNWVSKTGLALQLAYANTNTGDFPSDSGRWSIHNNIFDRLQYATCYGCGTYLIQMSSVVSPSGAVLHDITIDHNTFQLEDNQIPYGFLMIGGPVQGMANIRYTNNIQYYGYYGVWATDWKTTSCTYGGQKTLLTACFIGNSAFTGNTIFYQGTNLSAATAVFPIGNTVTTSGAIINTIQSALVNRKP